MIKKMQIKLQGTYQEDKFDLPMQMASFEDDFPGQSFIQREDYTFDNMILSENGNFFRVRCFIEPIPKAKKTTIDNE